MRHKHIGLYHNDAYYNFLSTCFIQAFSDNGNYITIPKINVSSRYFIVLSNFGVTGISGSIHGIYILEVSNNMKSLNLVNIINDGIDKVSLNDNTCTIYFTGTYISALILKIL